MCSVFAPRIPKNIKGIAKYYKEDHKACMAMQVPTGAITEQPTASFMIAEAEITEAGCTQ